MRRPTIPELERVLEHLIEDVVDSLWKGNHDFAAGIWDGAFLLAMTLDFDNTRTSPDSGWSWLNVVGWTNDARGEFDRRRCQDMPHFKCPRCKRVTYNPNDVRELYCGACHQWFA